MLRPISAVTGLVLGFALVAVFGLVLRVVCVSLLFVRSLPTRHVVADLVTGALPVRLALLRVSVAVNSLSGQQSISVGKVVGRFFASCSSRSASYQDAK